MAIRAGTLRTEGHLAVAQGEGPQDTGFAALPGWGGPAAPIPSGWALAVVASDPARRGAAAEFIAWLLAPERAGAWAQGAGWLPTTPAGLATWGADPYYDFLGQQLAGAVSLPAGSDYPQTAVRLQKAVIAVLKDNANPREAADTAINPPK
jgi:sn-glycerol 3-phosphate transport system substrate-binding protein